MKKKSSIPAGWYRICRLEELASRRRLQISRLGGIVEIQNTDQIRVFYRENEKDEAIELPSFKSEPFLFTWFSVDQPALFHIEPLAGLNQKNWSSPFHLEWTVRSNMIEIAENAADMGHFTTVHVYQEHARLRQFITLNHQMSVVFESARRILGFRVPVGIELHYQGLGWVESKVKSPMLEAYVLYTPTPIDEERIHIVLSLSFKKSWNFLFNWILRLALPWEVARDFERDIPIWENKKIHPHPILCAGDGPIMKLRGWAAQFSN